jgi:hypothetical protein
MKSICNILLAFILLTSITSCKKTTTPPANPGGPIIGDTIITVPADPAVATTIGFFLNDWTSKSFTAPAYIDQAISTSASNIVTVDASSVITKIPLSVFGQNAVYWMGPVTAEPLFINPINNLQPHILRFPGGSASDAYFWNASQGVNPVDAPAMLMNANGVLQNPGYNYGMTNLNWECSLDNYYSLLQQTQNQGLITINYGYARYGTSADPVAAAAHLAADWVRYDNGRTQYWEIGNENFGDWEWGYRIDTTVNKDHQPQYMTGALYAQHFQVFADSMKQAATETGHTIYIGAVTSEAPATQSWQTNTLQTWNAGLMAGIKNSADYYVVHNYFTPYSTNSPAAEILTDAINVPGQMMSYLTQVIPADGATLKPVALDEWNMFAVNSQQMVSNTSGLFSVLALSEILKNKYGMAARWDLLNGWSNGDDMGLFSAGDEPGISKWSPRPSFYYMYFYKKMLGDRMVPTTVANNTSLSAYSSTYSSGQVNVTLVNTGTTTQTVQLDFKNFLPGNRFYWYSLEGSNDNGNFSRKVLVNGEGPAQTAGGPSDYDQLKAYSSLTQNGVYVTVPSLGMVCLVVDKK